VSLGQVGENGNIDSVLNKAVGVLGHAELFEPVRDLLHRGDQGFAAGEPALSLHP
jgi:hypothetical protein